MFKSIFALVLVAFAVGCGSAPEPSPRQDGPPPALSDEGVRTDTTACAAAWNCDFPNGVSTFGGCGGGCVSCSGALQSCKGGSFCLYNTHGAYCGY